VVHRDVSPQNVLISTTGQVTVTDFGVAKALGQAHKATETGEMKGKLSYMAPEQITSREIDRRVDIFALGCVLYQITLGQRPFHGEDALATLYQLLEKDLVRPREINPDYPEELEQIVLRSLAKDRSERFSTAEEMQRALEHFLLSAERPLSESDIASALMDALGDSITARKDEIKRRARALDSGEVFEEHPAQGAAEAAAQTIDTSAGTVTDAPPEPFKKTSWMAAAAVFVTIGLGTIVALKLTGGEEGVSSQNVAAVERDLDAQGEAEKGAVRPDREQKVALGEADAAAAGEDEAGTPEKKSEAKAVPDVTVKVKAFPAGATIKLDGAEVGVGVYRAEIPRSTEGHILELSAPGYDTLTRALVFDRSQDLELSLKRTVVSARPSVQVTPPTKPTSSKTTKKAPRALDSENPFAVPQ
jgi:serine/threonine-protein kinase